MQCLVESSRQSTRLGKSEQSHCDFFAIACFVSGRGQGSLGSSRKIDDSRDRGEQVQGRYLLRDVQSSSSTTRFGSCIAGKIGDDGPSLAAPQFGANLPMGALDDGESDRSVSGRIRSTGPGSSDIDSFLVS